MTDDAFPALAMGLELYIHGVRQTGRTSRLVDSLQSGDTLVCSAGREAHRLSCLLREQNKTVTVLVIPVADLSKLHSLKREGNLEFDHCWVEEYYRQELEAIKTRLERLSVGFTRVYKTPPPSDSFASRWSSTKPEQGAGYKHIQD